VDISAIVLARNVIFYREKECCIRIIPPPRPGMILMSDSRILVFLAEISWVKLGVAASDTNAGLRH
jgi:hypothetical protein